MMGAIVLVNVTVRFGGIVDDGLVLREVVRASDFDNPRDARFARKRGEKVSLHFDLDRESLAVPLELRLHPRLVLVGESAELRAATPVGLVFRDLEKGTSRRRVLGIHEGRPLRVALELAPKHSGKLEVEIENLGDAWLMKFDRSSALILGARRSPAASILLGGLLLGLYAAVFGLIALYVRSFVGAGTAFLLGITLALCAASLDLLEGGVFSRGGDALGDALGIVLRLLLPNFDDSDVAAMMVRGRAPAWGDVARVSLHLVVEGLLLGILSRWRRA